MDRRQTLVRVVWLFTLCGLAAVAFVFLEAVVPDDRREVATKVVIDTTDLVVGEPRIVELSPTRPLIILRANPAQLNSIAVLEPHVWDSTVNSEMLDKGLLVHWALSTGKFGGCRLTHIPAGKTLVAGIEANVYWLGGYWGSGCDASYDYAGRAIKNPRYAYSEYIDRSPSLRSPKVTIVDQGHISVTID